MSGASSERKSELSQLNVLFCLMVVFIHVLSHSIVNLDRLSWQYALVLISQRLAFVSVPGFFFLSGIKLTLPRKSPQSLKHYYLSRVKKLLLPYLLAAAVYDLFFVSIGWRAFSPTRFLQGAAMGTLSAQFYFLIALFQFIFLTPLFRWLVNQYHPVILLPLSMGITCLSAVYFNNILQLFHPEAAFPYADRVFTTYLVYYLAGCCAGREYSKFLALLETNKSLLFAATLFFGIAAGILNLLVFSGRKAIPYLDLVNTLYFLSTILTLYALVVQHKAQLQKAANWLLELVDRASYLIYLYHCFVITIFNLYAPGLVGNRVSILLLLRILVVYPVTILGCVL